MTALAGQVQARSTEEQAEVVAPWDICLRQTSPGAFEGSMQYASLGDILIYRDCWSQSGVASCALPEGYLAVATSARPVDSMVNWCGKRVNEQTLAVALPNTQVDFIMPSQTPYLAMLLPARYLNTLFGDSKSRSSLAKFYHHACHPELGKRLIARLNWIIEYCLANPDLLEDPSHRNAFETCLIDDLAEMGFGLAHEPSRISLSARRKTFILALEYCESIRTKISVPQFAAQLSINRRTLELVFRENLGITPRQYLLSRRLHGAHQELRLLPPGTRSVTDVASDWGFTELGRFAGAYKNLFGELPSDTLNKAIARAPRKFTDLLH